MRRKLTSAECEYLEMGCEPAHIVATSRVGIELLVHYVGSVTLVDLYGAKIGHWAFDEVMEPDEVLCDYEEVR